jgi:hypothetical protein
MASFDLSYARTYPAPVGEAFERVQAFELSRLFDRRYAALPAIKAVRGQVGAWGTPGQTRTILLADGGSMRESLLESVAPQRFSYRIDQIRGPMKLLFSGVDGSWAFEPAGTGVRVRWSWTMHPAGRLGSLAQRPFRRMWSSYAALAFDRLELLLVD